MLSQKFDLSGSSIFRHLLCNRAIVATELWPLLVDKEVALHLSINRSAMTTEHRCNLIEGNFLQSGALNSAPFIHGELLIGMCRFAIALPTY